MSTYEPARKLSQDSSSSSFAWSTRAAKNRPREKMKRGADVRVDY
ncbi:MAG: hypothetical protein ACRD4W_02640 [Nitrososphaeraceae archaeon]